MKKSGEEVYGILEDIPGAGSKLCYVLAERIGGIGEEEMCGEQGSAQEQAYSGLDGGSIACLRGGFSFVDSEELCVVAV